MLSLCDRVKRGIWNLLVKSLLSLATLIVTEPNKRRLDIHIIQLESYAGQIIKGYGDERGREYIEQNTVDLNAVVLRLSTV